MGAYILQERERRTLFNKLQEARGNIRVVCRVRPMLARADGGGGGAAGGGAPPKCVVETGDGGGRAAASLGERAVCVRKPGMRAAKVFEFDHVFGPARL